MTSRSIPAEDGDETARSGYYPWRFAHPTGEDVTVPGPSFPIAMIDAEDLADWTVRSAERSVGSLQRDWLRHNPGGGVHDLSRAHCIAGDGATCHRRTASRMRSESVDGAKVAAAVGARRAVAQHRAARLQGGLRSWPAASPVEGDVGDSAVRRGAARGETGRVA